LSLEGKDWIEILARILEAFSIAVTAYFATRSLNAWRNETIGRRKLDLADAILVAGHNARDALAYIRRPISCEAEGTKRGRDATEEASVARLKDAYYVPYERVQKTADVFADLAKNKFLAETYFGRDVEEAIDVLLRVRNEVLSAADILMDDVGSGDTSNEMKEIRREAKLKVYSRTKGDPLRPKIDMAVATIDDKCGGYLRSLGGG